MKKQILAMILCALMVLAVFTACNPASSSSGTESKGTESSDGSSKVESDAVREVVLVRYGGPDAYIDSKTVDAELNKILGDKYGLNVTQTWLSDYNSTLQLKVSTKEKLDVFWCNGGTLTDALVKSNGLYDISAKLKEHTDLYDTIPENVWNSIAYEEGQIYHVPCYKESGVGCDFMMNAEIAEELNLDFSKYTEENPMTLDDVTSVLQAIAEGTSVQTVFQPSAYTIQYAREYVMQDTLVAITPYLGLDLTADDSKIVNLVATDAYANYIDVVSGWVDAGYVYQDFLIDTDAQLTYENGALAAKTVGATVWCRVPDNQANVNDRYSCEVALAPMTGTMMNNTSALGSAYSLPVYSEDPDAALDLLAAMYTDLEVADLVCFGIEGVHYDREGDFVVRRTDVGYGADPWACVNVMCVSLKKGESPDKQQQYADFNASAELSPLCGFHADFSEVEAEKAACDAVVSTYEKTLCAGFSTDDVTLEKYRAELKTCGVDKIVEVVQAQYAEWLASK